MTLAASAASAFLCFHPMHHDGDAIRCAGQSRSMRLYGIDAPEMPGACRPGRECVPGDPYSARDHLASLTKGRAVTCQTVDTDYYGRSVVRCTADGSDLSCAMVRDGYAVRRYGNLSCSDDHIVTQNNGIGPGLPEYMRRFNVSAEAAHLAIYLIVLNAITYLLIYIDKRQARQWRRRIPEKILLLLAALGGSGGALIAQQVLRHKTRKQPFATILICIAGIQAGVVIGIAVL